jgi:hypothetical protein
MSELVFIQNGHEYYAPPPETADKLEIDSTGRIARTLEEVTQIVRSDGSVYLYNTDVTFFAETVDNSNAFWDIINADPTSFPVLKSAFDSALINSPPPTTGDVISTPTGNQLIGPVTSGMQMSMSCVEWLTTPKYVVYSTYIVIRVAIGDCTDGVYGDGNTQNFNRNQHNFSPTSLPVSPVVINFIDPLIGAESEVDNFIYQNPNFFSVTYNPSASDALISPQIATPLTSEIIAGIIASVQKKSMIRITNFSRYLTFGKGDLN